MPGPIVLLALLGLLLTAGCTAKPDAAGSSPVALRLIPERGIQPEAARDSTGRIHLLYFAGQPNHGDLYYVVSTDDGATFSKPLRVNSREGSAVATGTVRGGQLALGPNGRPHVVWNDSGHPQPGGPVDPTTGRRSFQLFYSRLDDSGAAFEPQRDLLHHTVNLDGGASIAADSNGSVYVAWHGNDARSRERDESHRAVWITRSLDGGAKFEEERLASDEAKGACGCCAVKLLAETPDTFLLYRSATALTSRDIYFLRSPDGGRSFKSSRVDEWRINACPMTTMTLARSGERLLGGWETEGRVVFAELDATAGTIRRRIDVSVRSNTKHPRVATNDRGESLLVWAAGTSWSRGGSLAWRMLDAAGRPDPRTSGPVDGPSQSIPVWSYAAAVARRDGGFVIFH
jgi:hypothetical protein